MGELDLTDDLREVRLEQTLTSFVILRGVIERRGRFDEGLIPLGTLLRLDAIVVPDLHQLALFDEGSQFGLHAFAEAADVALEVSQQQIGDCLGIRADTRVDTGAAGQAVDKEDQASDALTEASLVRAVIETRNTVT